MATNVYFRGRCVWSSQPTRAHVRAVAGVVSMPVQEWGDPLPGPEPPPPDAIPLGDQYGPVVEDPEDGIAYRTVGGTAHVLAGKRIIRADAGWKTTAAWCAQLKCSMKQLALLVKLGCFDAAIERGTMHRCLRSLDLEKAKRLLTQWANELPVEKKKVRRI